MRPGGSVESRTLAARVRDRIRVRLHAELELDPLPALPPLLAALLPALVVHVGDVELGFALGLVGLPVVDLRSVQGGELGDHSLVHGVAAPQVVRDHIDLRDVRGAADRQRVTTTHDLGATPRGREELAPREG